MQEVQLVLFFGSDSPVMDAQYSQFHSWHIGLICSRRKPKCSRLLSTSPSHPTLCRTPERWEGHSQIKGFIFRLMFILLKKTCLLVSSGVPLQNSSSKDIWMPPTAWLASRWLASWWWRTRICPSRVSICSWCEWRPAVSINAGLMIDEPGFPFLHSSCSSEAPPVCCCRLCWRLRQRRHRNPEHPDRWGWRLPRPLHSHLHGVPSALHLPHTGDHQLQSRWVAFQPLPTQTI